MSRTLSFEFCDAFCAVETLVVVAVALCADVRVDLGLVAFEGTGERLELVKVIGDHFKIFMV